LLLRGRRDSVYMRRRPAAGPAAAIMGHDGQSRARVRENMSAGTGPYRGLASVVYARWLAGGTMRGAARRGRWGFEVALLCGLLVGWAEPDADHTAAAAAVVGPAAGVAVVAVGEGTVSVRDAAGVEVAATVEMPLARTDTVITTPGALVVVVLANG